jgi:hypothetical protein
MIKSMGSRGVNRWAPRPLKRLIKRGEWMGTQTPERVIKEG